MPIFELDEGNLVPFRRQAIESGIYEAEIEALLWDNLEEITGDNLFRVARQATLPSGGRPDIVALDPSGRVVVIEVKRDVDRNQLAQSLEYAGWARNTSLDELAGLFHAGERDFWAEWQEFTGTPTPVVVKVAFYVDENGRRFLNVEWTEEPEAVPVHIPATADDADDAPIEVVDTEARDYREVTLAEVADAIGAPTALVWIRPRKGERFEATLLANGVIQLASGVEHRSPSGAAMAVADVVSYDGWYAWRVGEGGPTLNDFRRRVVGVRPRG